MVQHHRKDVSSGGTSSLAEREVRGLDQGWFCTIKTFRDTTARGKHASYMIT